MKKTCNNKKKQIRIYDSWIFVILASIIDMFLIIPLPGCRGGVPIFELSKSLGPLGRKRQRLLPVIVVSIIEIAIIGIAIWGIAIQSIDIWLPFSIIGAVVGLLLWELIKLWKLGI